VSGYDREQRVRDAIKARGLTLERIGVVWRVYGPGVDIRTTALSTVTASDLAPVVTERDARRYGPW